MSLQKRAEELRALLTWNADTHAEDDEYDHDALSDNDEDALSHHDEDDYHFTHSEEDNSVDDINAGKFALTNATLNTAQDKEEEECCPICLQDYSQDDKVVTLNRCKHQMHSSCAQQWLQVKPSCPVCRTSALNHEANDADDISISTDTEYGGSYTDSETEDEEEDFQLAGTFTLRSRHDDLIRRQSVCGVCQEVFHISQEVAFLPCCPQRIHLGCARSSLHSRPNSCPLHCMQ